MRQTSGNDVVPILLRVPRPEVAYVKFVFESYEGVAVCRTLDRHEALIVVLAVPDFLAQARTIAAALAAEGACEDVTDQRPCPADLLGASVDDPNP